MRPSISTAPSSDSWTPASTLTSVDFPAPFSPTRATTSPDDISRSTSSKALTPGKDLPTPVNLNVRASPVGGILLIRLPPFGLVPYLTHRTSELVGCPQAGWSVPPEG